jgi:glycosyltransferase involved in cell wall biosynthesis
MGRADSALEVIAQARIMLAPIQFGAGVKGKLLEAMQAGTPSVTTTIGAEAMHINNQWNGFIADEDDAFISAAVRLYTDESIWQQAQKTGIEMLQTRYNKKKFEAILKDRIDALFLNLKAHRQKHFLGQILQHHTLGSTRYMAKWIEAKNKNT